MNDKPQNRLGYSTDVTESIRSTCLSVAVTLGDYLAEVVVVGGLVPSLLTEGHFLLAPPDDDRHVGTMDLDLGLSLSVLDDERYAAISERLKAEGFAPDLSEDGNPIRQRWQRNGLTIDFLIPEPSSGAGGGLQSLQADFAAIQTQGLGLAFEERVDVLLEGFTLSGHRATRSVGVCGPGAFVALKALAFHNRSEPKDAYDLVHVLRFVPEGVRRIAEMLGQHSVAHETTVALVVEVLEADFATVDHIGPRKAAEFISIDPDSIEDAAADAHGFVDDLLRECRDVLG